MKILVVDNDALGAESLTALLGTRGHEAEFAVNAEGALARMAVRRFDVLITDEVMPGVDGLELINVIRGIKEYQDLPVIVLTALTGEDVIRIEKELALLAPAKIVQKPVVIEDLLATIKALGVGN